METYRLSTYALQTALIRRCRASQCNVIVFPIPRQNPLHVAAVYPGRLCDFPVSKVRILSENLQYPVETTRLLPQRCNEPAFGPRLLDVLAACASALHNLGGRKPLHGKTDDLRFQHART